MKLTTKLWRNGLKQMTLKGLEKAMISRQIILGSKITEKAKSKTWFHGIKENRESNILKLVAEIAYMKQEIKVRKSL